MDNVTRTRRGSLGMALVALLSAPHAAGAQAAFGQLLNKPTPALAEFERTYHGLRDYAATVAVFERSNDGTQVEVRSYAYKVLKPTALVATILSGSGAGAFAAWRGGDTVKVHDAGSLSQIKLTIPIDDPRVRTLRGDTVDTGTFAYDLQYMLATPGTLAELPGPTISGVATTAVTLAVKDPAVAAVTKAELDLSTATHLPARRKLYVGSTVVKTETFTNIKTNLGLGTHDLEI